MSGRRLTWRHGILAVIALVVVLMIGSFLHNFSRETKTYYAPKNEARHNPYFAAKLILTPYGKTLSYYPSWNQSRLEDFWQALDRAPDTTLILNVDNDSVAEILPDALSWVRAGGQLIVYNGENWYDDNELDTSGISNHPSDSLLGDEFEQSEFEDWAYAVPLRINGNTLVAKGSLRQFDVVKFAKEHNGTVVDLRVGADFGNTLPVAEQAKLKAAYQSFPELNNPHRALAMVNLGQGQMVFLQDEVQFDNTYYRIYVEDKPAPKHSRLWQLLTGTEDSDLDDGIMQKDHAFLLHQLTGKRQAVTVVQYMDEGRSFWGLLSRQVPFLLLGLLLGALAILLALPRQFGRQRYLHATHSNDLLHYLTAVGQYKANIDNNQAQVADNRAALLTKIALRVPYLQGIHGIDERCAMIAKDCQLPIKTVYQGLYASWQTDEEFLGVGQAFAQLWQHYY